MQDVHQGGELRGMRGVELAVLECDALQKWEPRDAAEDGSEPGQVANDEVPDPAVA